MSEIAAYYDELAHKYGRTEAACDAANPDALYIRRKVLAQFCRLLVPPARSVLEVGCAYGALLEFLPSELVYTGIDISKQMIALAQSGKADFRRQDLMETQGSWDLVVAEGIFYKLRLDKKTRYDADAMIAKMWQHARHGLAFCTLSRYTKSKTPMELYLSPEDTFAFCRQFTPYVTLRHDYLPHDFCIQMYREPKP